MKTFEHQIQAEASREALWRVLSDVPGWPDWIIDLHWVRLDGPFQEGAHGVLKPHHGPEQSFRLERIIPSEVLAIGVPHALVQGHVLFTLEDRPSGVTAVQSRIAVSGALAWMIASQVKKRVADRFPEFLWRLTERAGALET